MRMRLNFKNILSLFVAIFCSMVVNGKNAMGWVKELSPAFDSTVVRGDVSSFWTFMQNKDREYRQLLSAIKRNRKTIREANRTLSRAKFGEYSYLEEIKECWDFDKERIKKLESDLHFDEIRRFLPDSLSRTLSINFAVTDEENASTFPDGKIVIYQGLLLKLNHEELLAVCAHELTHFLMQHALNMQYSYIKKMKSNKVWADISGALLAGISATANAYNAAITGTKVPYQDYGAFISELEEGTESSSINYRFRYSRREEYQADIIGLRYLQFLGYSGESYLSMLNKISPKNYKEKKSKKDTHPTMATRKEIISLLLNNGN